MSTDDSQIIHSKTISKIEYLEMDIQRLNKENEHLKKRNLELNKLLQCFLSPKKSILLNNDTKVTEESK